jgi:hypothetical protein
LGTALLQLGGSLFVGQTHELPTPKFEHIIPPVQPDASAGLLASYPHAGSEAVVMAAMPAAPAAGGGPAAPVPAAPIAAAAMHDAPLGGMQ